ncbi:hypothetical protein CPB84DRAFT_1448736 [Gymnopilus junonius]|uniref:T6SS Phospholipase effector Tle1-like catalytic domain-containing protein n=1 Tax=Gymnopilus junonius TaxID=109634 RepID=A0A9P5NIZ5_GYMJU|nr:hypothetical protein CPB84DRAFT_1448736 [Gymnopilus junonius]
MASTIRSETQTTNGSHEPVPSSSSSSISPIIDTVPPKHPFRTLVLCFDGTGDQFDSDNSNIIEFFSMLKKDDPAKQLVYYQAGIGTYTVPEIATPMMSKLSQTLDMAIAWNLDAHIMGGYEFLMQNYRAGDRICIFGFSRGAYTARCLAGMIHKVGLLPTSNTQQVPFAYKMYTRADEKGVWDTVASVGLIPRRLPFTTSNTVVKTFRHAVSLDERRAKFKANLWNRPNEIEQFLSITDRNIEELKKKQKHSHSSQGGSSRSGSLMALETKYTKDWMAATDIDEVWFAGCHCDIGGGSVENGIKPCLARIPLRWMIRECFKAKSGIMFSAEGLKCIGLDPGSLYPTVLPRPPALPLDTSSLATCSIQSIPKKLSVEQTVQESSPFFPIELAESEEEADRKDALAPIYDQLILNKFWWLLEIIPVKLRFQKANHTTWKTVLHWNMGGGREIPPEKHGIKIHRTVKMRMEAEDAQGKKYHPKAKLDFSSVTWVE